MAPLSLSMITIPPQTAEQLKLVAAAATFYYVGTTFAHDIVHSLRQTKPGRRAVRWVYQHPTAARCLLLTGTGALIAAWPSTVAKLLTLVGGLGSVKEDIIIQQSPPIPPPQTASFWDNFKLADYLPVLNPETESGFSTNYRGGTTGFVGILQSAAAGKAASVTLIRRIGYGVAALSGAGVALALQWRRLRALFYSIRNKIASKKDGSSSGKESSSSKKTSRGKEEKKDKERESSSHHYSTPSFPSSSSSSAAVAAAAAAAAPPPPPPAASSSSSRPYGVTSPPPSEFEDHTDAESIYSRKGSKSHRSSKDKKDRKDKEKKHRK